MTGSDIPSSFRLAYVPGVTPTKWVRVWRERLPDTPLELVQATAADAPGLLADGGADAGLYACRSTGTSWPRSPSTPRRPSW
ncbi:hypothetical protein SBADM41S_12112 [Streptomyces badius]